MFFLCALQTFVACLFPSPFSIKVKGRDNFARLVLVTLSISVLQKSSKNNKKTSYSVFHKFRQAKFAYGGSILSFSQNLLLPQLPQKMKLAVKVVKSDSKIIISLPWSKSVKLNVDFVFPFTEPFVIQKRLIGILPKAGFTYQHRY